MKRLTNWFGTAILSLSLTVGALSGGALAQSTSDPGGRGTTTSTTATNGSRDNRDNHGFDWGWLGLLGLVGLLGLIPRRPDTDYRNTTGTTTRTP